MALLPPCPAIGSNWVILVSLEMMISLSTHFMAGITDRHDPLKIPLFVNIFRKTRIRRADLMLVELREPHCRGNVVVPVFFYHIFFLSLRELGDIRSIHSLTQIPH